MQLFGQCRQFTFFWSVKNTDIYNSNPSLPKLLIVHKVYGVYLQDI